MNVTPSEFVQLQPLIHTLCGIVIDESKTYLIETRLSGVCEKHNFTTFTDLITAMKQNMSIELRVDIINAITTNETLFFRDVSPFQGLKYKIIPELIDAKQKSATPKKIRIWSAACSTGQEPYSIAMMLSDMLPDIMQWDIHILGTDISDDVIKKASYGKYQIHEIKRGLTEEQIEKYFTFKDDGYYIKDEIRYLVNFSHRNLLEPFTNMGLFDIVLCRNVAIYFDDDTRKHLFQRISNLITPQGYLVVGSSENLSDLGENYISQQHCRSSFYQPNATSVSCL